MSLDWAPQARWTSAATPVDGTADIAVAIAADADVVRVRQAMRAMAVAASLSLV